MVLVETYSWPEHKPEYQRAIVAAILETCQEMPREVGQIIESYVRPFLMGPIQRVSGPRSSSLVNQAFQIDAAFSEKLKQRGISLWYANNTGHAFSAIGMGGCSASARASANTLFYFVQESESQQSFRYNLQAYGDNRMQVIRTTISPVGRAMYFNVIDDRTVIIIQGRSGQTQYGDSDLIPGRVFTVCLINGQFVMETKLNFPQRVIHAAEISKEGDRLYLAFRGKDGETFGEGYYNHCQWESYRLPDFVRIGHFRGSFNFSFLNPRPKTSSPTFTCESIFAHYNSLVMHYSNSRLRGPAEIENLFVFATVEQGGERDVISPVSIYRYVRHGVQACALINQCLVLKFGIDVGQLDLFRFGLVTRTMDKPLEYSGEAFEPSAAIELRAKLHRDTEEALRECDRIKVQNIIDGFRSFPNLNVKDARGDTIFHIIARSLPAQNQDAGDHLNLQMELYRALIKGGADLHIPEAVGQTFSQLASRELLAKIVEESAPNKQS